MLALPGFDPGLFPLWPACRAPALQAKYFLVHARQIYSFVIRIIKLSLSRNTVIVVKI